MTDIFRFFRVVGEIILLFFVFNGMIKHGLLLNLLLAVAFCYQHLPNCLSTPTLLSCLMSTDMFC